MSPASSSNSVQWSFGRWLCVFIVVFSVQAGLIVALSSKVSATKRRPVRTAVRLLTGPFSERQAFSSLFASDPTVFAIANLRGFSGRAWLEMPAQNFSIPDWDEPVRWLQINEDQLGAVFTNFLKGVGDGSPQWTEKISLPLASIDSDLGQPVVSRCIIEGDFAARSPVLTLDPPVWRHVDVLRSSIVQIAVDGSGTVVLARLLSPRSGSAEADRTALALSRQIAFKPVNTGNAATNLASGKVVFQWQTMVTNSVSEYE